MFGGDHDLMDRVSHNDAPGVHVPAAESRRLLRSIMEDSGLSAYQCEWWHHTLAGEPFPDTSVAPADRQAS